MVHDEYQLDVLLLDIGKLTFLKEVTPAMRTEIKFKQIAASLEHIGLIEPIVVFPESKDKYLVLDGHKRLDILKSRGVSHVRCLIATDDESYTYNKRVNYLPPIGEHYMILKALADDITEDGLLRHSRSMCRRSARNATFLKGYAQRPPES